MEKIKSFFKMFISLIVVMMGSYLISFYLRNDMSIVSILCGIVGFWIVYPAIKEWEKILWGNNANSK